MFGGFQIFLYIHIDVEEKCSNNELRRSLQPLHTHTHPYHSRYSCVPSSLRLHPRIVLIQVVAAARLLDQPSMLKEAAQAADRLEERWAEVGYANTKKEGEQQALWWEGVSGVCVCYLVHSSPLGLISSCLILLMIKRCLIYIPLSISHTRPHL
jgi:hypothetical protein